MTRHAIVGLGALLVAWIGGETAAQACGPHASATRQRLLGVGPDGTFVTASTVTGEVIDGENRSFEVHDADGHEIGSLNLFAPGEAAEPPGLESSESTSEAGQEPAALLTSGRLIDGDSGTQLVLAQLPGGLDPLAITRALIAHYHLTPLHASPLKAHVPPPPDGSVVVDEARPLVDCDTVHVRTREGVVPVLEVGAVDHTQRCSEVRVTALQHPASSLLFLQLAYVVPLDCMAEKTCNQDDDRVAWVPARRLTGVRAAERGHRALEAGQTTSALAALDESLRLDPDYVRARLWAMQALAASHAPATMAQRWVETPFSPTEACFGGDTAKLDLWLDTQAPASWHVDETWERPWRACSGSIGDTPPEPATDDDTAEPGATADSDDGPEPSDEDAVPDLDPPTGTGTDEEIVITPRAPTLEAPRSVWWFDPESTLLGAAAVASFVLAHRRGSRARR